MLNQFLFQNKGCPHEIGWAHKGSNGGYKRISATNLFAIVVFSTFIFVNNVIPYRFSNV